MRPTFEKELQTLINRHSAENSCNTPDFILAKYMSDCLQAFIRGVRAREQWYGYEMHPGMGDVAQRTKTDMAIS